MIMHPKSFKITLAIIMVVITKISCKEASEKGIPLNYQKANQNSQLIANQEATITESTGSVDTSTDTEITLPSTNSTGTTSQSSKLTSSTTSTTKSTTANNSSSPIVPNEKTEVEVPIAIIVGVVIVVMLLLIGLI